MAKTERLLSRKNKELRAGDDARPASPEENEIREKCYTRGFQQGISSIVQKMHSEVVDYISIEQLEQIEIIAYKMRYRHDRKSYFWFANTFKTKIGKVLRRYNEI
jgi:hypothetical protein